MSGDVQPRKRKDKRKRKDEEGYSLNEDVSIHVHKESGTGGNICAKIVFFFLFSALIVLIGLIIKENQGLSEIKEIESESRYSQIFEGWVDKSPEDHEDDNHSPELSHELDHDHEEDDEDDEHYVSEEENVEGTDEEQSEEVEDESEDGELENEEDESLARSDEEINDQSEEEDQVDETEEEYTAEDNDETEELSLSQEEVKEESEEIEVDSVETSKADDVEDIKADDVEEDEYDKEKDESKQELSDEEKDRDDEVVEENEDNLEELQEKINEKEEEAKDELDEAKAIDKEKEDTEEKDIEDNEEAVKESSGNINVAENQEYESDKEDYEHSDITNQYDYNIREEIDAAAEQLPKNAAYANKLFEALLEKHPVSPRILHGKAKALDILAEERQSNELLQRALSYYLRALSAPDVPDGLFVLIAERYIDRARFIGQYNKAIAVHWQMVERFPNTPKYLNSLAVTYLTINLIEDARSVLKRVLSRWPNDGFALVHYGFVLKTADNNLEDSVRYMSKGLKTKEPGVVDGRFYFHLGDALTRLNKNQEAMRLYEEGVRENVFMSKYQRSLYNVPRLSAKPWWEPSDLPIYQKLFSALKENWKEIRREGLSALNDRGYFKDEAENLKDTGTWKQLELFARGQKFSKNCDKSPITCGIIQSFPDARGCRRGQSKFSVMHPGTHVWPHCGPTNCRLRIHLGLKVPPKTFIRVAEETRSWKEGELLIFDDSFEHEVWHNGSEFRLVLIVDIWHPELTPAEKRSLSSI